MSNYKYYWCKTQEEYDWLMNKLEKEGCRWNTGARPSEENNFLEYGDETVVKEEDGRKLLFSEINFYLEENGLELSDFIFVSDIMKEEERKDHKKKPNPSPIPNHYQIEGIGDSMDTLIHIVKHNTDDVAEGIKLFNTLKYLFRYGKKNGIEDLKKARHYLDMLIEGVEE